MGDWSFLTNHAHVLLCIAADPDVRLRAIGDAVGVGERAAHRLVCDLVEGGYVSKRRVGRRNCYAVNRDAPLRRAPYRDHTVGELLDVLAAPPAPAAHQPPPSAGNGRAARAGTKAVKKAAAAPKKALRTTAKARRSRG